MGVPAGKQILEINGGTVEVITFVFTIILSV